MKLPHAFSFLAENHEKHILTFFTCVGGSEYSTLEQDTEVRTTCLSPHGPGRCAAADLFVIAATEPAVDIINRRRGASIDWTASI